jgi:hypothetical protein
MNVLTNMLSFQFLFFSSVREAFKIFFCGDWKSFLFPIAKLGWRKLLLSCDKIFGSSANYDIRGCVEYFVIHYS